MVTLYLVVALAMRCPPVQTADTPPIAVRVTPSSPYVEAVGPMRHLSLDFILTNRSDRPIDLTSVRLMVYDRSGKLVLRRFTENGLSASLQSETTILPAASILLLNPYSIFPADLPLYRLDFEFMLLDKKSGTEHSVHLQVRPRTYRQKARLSLPVAGPILVYVGHDFYGHHRRVDMTHPMVAKLGVKTNPTRFAYDLCVADSAGRIYRGQGKKNEEWLGWDSPVLAPASGRVLESRNDVIDNILGKTGFDPASIGGNVKGFLGNFVAIEHPGGEVSVLAHLHKGSVRAVRGQLVRSGQEIGRIGLSGDSEYVHLHYQIQAGFQINSETLPAAFSNFDRVFGADQKHVESDALQSGEYVVSRSAAMNRR
jgi:hypothetical protein